MVKALVKLRVVVDQWWLEELAVVVVGRLGEFDGRGLMVVLQGLVHLQRAAAAAGGGDRVAGTGGGMEVIQGRVWAGETLLERKGLGKEMVLQQGQGEGWQGQTYLRSRQQQVGQEQLLQLGMGIEPAHGMAWVEGERWGPTQSGELQMGGFSRGLVVQPVHGRFGLEWYESASCCEGELGRERQEGFQQQKNGLQSEGGQWVVREIAGARGVGLQHGKGGAFGSSSSTRMTGAGGLDTQYGRRAAFSGDGCSSSSRGMVLPSAAVITAVVGGKASLLDEVLTEVYGIASLTMLMPGWMSEKFRQWPLAVAAQDPYRSLLGIGQRGPVKEACRLSAESVYPCT